MSWQTEATFDMSSSSGLTLGTAWSVGSGTLNGVQSTGDNMAYPTSAGAYAIRRWSFDVTTIAVTTRRAVDAYIVGDAATLTTTSCTNHGGGVFFYSDGNIYARRSGGSSILTTWNASTTYSVVIVADAGLDRFKVKIGSTWYWWESSAVQSSASEPTLSSTVGFIFVTNQTSLSKLAFNAYDPTRGYTEVVDNLVADYFWPDLASSDSATVGESVNVEIASSLADVQVSSSDAATVAETIAMAIAAPLAVASSDAATVGEAAALSVAAAPPTVGTLAATGTADSQALGGDDYGNIWLGYTEAGSGEDTTGLKCYQASSSGGTFSEVTSKCTITQPTGTTWLINVRRPENAPDGTTYYYKIKATGGGGDSSYSNEVSGVSDLDIATATTNTLSMLDTLTNAQTGDKWVSSSSGEVYPGHWLAAFAYAYSQTSSATWSTYAQNQFEYIQTLDDANGLIKLPDYTSYVYRDHFVRTVLHTALAERLINQTGGADTLTSNMRTQIVTWAKAIIDNLARSVVYSASGDHKGNPTVQPAWVAATAYEVGAIVRPTSANGRQYSATVAGTSAGSEPTWPTTTNGTVTDGGVTWTEDSIPSTITTFAATYNPSSPYAATASTAYTADLNQQMEIAALFALLTSDSRYTDFYSGGGYNSAAVDIVADQVAIAVRFCNDSTGAIPIGDGYLSTYDTLYGRFTLWTMTIVRAVLGENYSPRLTRAINQAMDWLDNSYGTEPTIGGEYYSGAHAPYLVEIAMQRAIYAWHGRTNLLSDIDWTCAFRIATTHKIADYVENGATSALMDAHQGRLLAWWMPPAFSTIGVADGATVGEAVALVRSVAAVAVADGATVGEAVALVRSVAAVAVADAATVGEAVALAVSTAQIAVSDGVSVGDAAVVVVVSHLETQPSGNADDGHFLVADNATFEAVGSTSINVGIVGSFTYSGFVRWPVTLPANAQIHAAAVTWVDWGTASAPTSAITINVAGHDAANPAAPTSNAEANGAPRTTADVDWVWPTDLAQVEGTAHDTPDLSAIIQELIDSYDYSSGAALTLYFDMVSGPSSKLLAFDALDRGLGTGATLSIAYSYPPNIGASDAVTVGEAVALAVDAPLVMAADGATVGEAVALAIALIGVADAASVADAPVLAVAAPLVVAVDGATVGEAVALAPQTQIGVADAASVADAPVLAVDAPLVAVADGATVGEAVQVLAVALIGVADAASVADAPVLAVDAPLVVVADAVTVAESGAVIAELVDIRQLSASNGVGVADAPVLAVAAPLLVLADGVGVGESINVTVQVAQVVAADGVVVAEAIAISVSSAQAVIVDGATVGEAVALVVSTALIAVSDGVSVLDVAAVQVTAPALHVGDGVTVAEAVAGVVQVALAVLDSLTVVDAALIASPVVGIITGDGLAVVDSPGLDREWVPVVMVEGVSVGELVGMIVQSLMRLADVTLSDHSVNPLTLSDRSVNALEMQDRSRT